MSDPWRLDNPIGALDRWIVDDKPDDDLRRLITVWFLGFDDPYKGDFDPVNPAAWSIVAGTLPPHSRTPERCVLVSYRISPAERRIFVDFISTMSWPV